MKSHWHHQNFGIIVIISMDSALRHESRPGLEFPVKTEVPFITQSLWYHPSSVGWMSSLRSNSPKSVQIKESSVWSSDNGAKPQSRTLHLRILATKSSSIPFLWMVSLQIATLNKAVLKSTTEKHKKSKKGRAFSEETMQFTSVTFPVWVT